MFGLAATVLLATPLVAATPGPQATPPAAHAMRLGADRLVALRDAEFLAPADGSIFGADQPAGAVVKALAAAGLPTDGVRLSVDALLVAMPNRMVLIDTGLGPHAKGNLMGSLAVAGVKPAQINDILITHSHGDHVGGLIDAAGHPAFPNAHIHMSAPEWTWLQSQTGAQKLVEAIRPAVRTFTLGDEVVPGIRSVDLPGHTPGHSGYLIQAGRHTLLDIGDMAHSSLISLAHPDWAMGFDSDKALGRRTRMTELARLAATHQLIFAPHFPFPGFGRVIRRGGAYAWQPAP